MAEPRRRDSSWIGRRIGELRRARAWTLVDLAGAVDLSPTQLSRIESGARQPSVGTLLEIAHAFGVSLSDLVAESRGEAFHVVRAAERTSSPTANGEIVSLSGRFPGIQAVHAAIEPVADAPEARHDGEEWVYVLSGPVEVRIVGEVVALVAGDAIHFSSRAPHSMRSPGEKVAEVLIVSARPS